MKLKPTILALAGVLMTISAANADTLTNDSKSYIGVDFQYSVASYKPISNGTLSVDLEKVLENKLNGLNIYAGIRPGTYWGVELGYFRTEKAFKNIAVGTDVGLGSVATRALRTDALIKGVTLDVLGYLPLADAGFELIGTAGFSYQTAQFAINAPDLNSIYVSDESEFGFRLGAGVQYYLTDNFNLRGIVRYQSADFDNLVDRIITYSLGGVGYSF